MKFLSPFTDLQHVGNHTNGHQSTSTPGFERVSCTFLAVVVVIVVVVVVVVVAMPLTIDVVVVFSECYLNVF